MSQPKNRWQEIPLGEVLTFQRGFDITKKQQQPGAYAVISSSGPGSTHNEFKVKGPGVAIGRKGTLGTVFFSEKDFWPHDTTLWVKDFHGNDEGFAYYFLQTLHLEQYDCGASNPTLNRNHIHTIPVRYPPLPVQRKIAGILSAYDDLIENNTWRIKILEEMARSLYREWFVHFRFPGHEQVQMVDSELGLIPEGWDVKPLSDVCLRITDGSHWSPKTVDDGYPMASVKDMHNWGFHLEQCRKISEEDYNNLVKNDCKPLKNDVLVAKDGSYLKHIFVINKEVDMVILSSIALLRPNDRILPHVLFLYLLEPSIKARMASYVSGAALPRIILKDFKKILVLVPPLYLQKRLFSFAEPMIRNCYHLIEKNANLRRTRDLLLPNLISGEINV